MGGSDEIGRIIQKEEAALAGRIVARLYDEQPETWGRFGGEAREKSVRDAGYHLSYLSEALMASDPTLFVEYVAWVKVLFTNLGFAEDVLLTTLECMRDVLEDRTTRQQRGLLKPYLDEGVKAVKEAPSTPPSYVGAQTPLGQLTRRYVTALLDGDRHAAGQMIMEAVEGGTPVREIYLNVFQPAQREIGRLWQTNQISVAEEHYCTAATQLVMSQLYPRIFGTKRTGHCLVATCVGGELHEIGVRMVADFFEMEGWDTYYLGANTPSESVLTTIRKREPDLLAVSATITMHVGKVRTLVGQVRAMDAAKRTKVLVGGYPFNIAPDLWRQVGADGCAANAQEAIALAARWMAEG